MDVLLDTSDPFIGIFSKYYKFINVETSEGTEFMGNYSNLFFKTTKDNYHPRPEVENTSISFLFPKHVILPTAYMLEGRSYTDANQLKNWEFYGKNQNGEWILLDEKSDHRLQYQTVEIFPISADESFNAFKLQMRGKDSNDKYFLCIGTINVFGSIARSFEKCSCNSNNQFFINYFLSLLISK